MRDVEAFACHAFLQARGEASRASIFAGRAALVSPASEGAVMLTAPDGGHQQGLLHFSDTR